MINIHFEFKQKHLINHTAVEKEMYSTFNTLWRRRYLYIRLIIFLIFSGTDLVYLRRKNRHFSVGKKPLVVKKKKTVLPPGAYASWDGRLKTSNTITWLKQSHVMTVIAMHVNATNATEAK